MKTLFTALLAASALLPAAAQAQHVALDVDANALTDRPERGSRPDRGERPQFRQQADVGVRADARAERPDRPDRQAFGQDLNRDGRSDRQNFDRDRRDDRQAYRGGEATQHQFQPDRRDNRQDFRADTRVDRQEFRADRRDDRHDYQADRRDDRRDAAQGRPGWQNYSAFRGSGGFQGQRYGHDRYDTDRYGNRGGSWNRGWRSDNRYDWNRYRTVNRGAYRLPRYYAPSGWGYGYRRFSIGVTLSAGLWDQNYWIDDPYAYRLPDAYGPYRWVRYYDDALLIDVRTGRVVDTVYGIFY